MRLFIAIHFSEQVNKLLLESMKQLKSQVISANLTRQDNLHLTLAFIGESNKVSSIRKVIEEVVPERPFEIQVGGAGCFGDLWWVGIERNPLLTALAIQLQDGLRAEGFPIEQRDFKPHITIARKVSSYNPIHLGVPPEAMMVDHVSLMKSERIDGRLTYTEIYCCSFGAEMR